MRLHRMFFCGALLFCAAACGVARPDIPAPLASLQPRVADVLPSPAAALTTRSAIRLALTQAVVPEQVSSDSVGVVSITDDASDADVLDQFTAQENLVPSTVALEDDHATMQITPTTTWPDQALVAVVITPDVASPEGVPVGNGPAEPSGVVVRYAVSDAIAAEAASAAAAGNAMPADSALPADVSPPPSVSAACQLGELLYDVPGSDTNGDVFVELWCTPGADASDWAVRLVNGDDGAVYATLRIPAGTLIPDDGILVIADAIGSSGPTSHVAAVDVVLNFDPQNGPDAVQIVNPAGQVVDVLGYGGALAVTVDADGAPVVIGDAVPKVTAGQSVARGNQTPGVSNRAAYSAGVPTPGVK